MIKKLIYIFSSLIFFICILYVAAGFYLANTILKIDPSCGLHEGSLPNTWSTLVDHHEYTNVNRSILRKNFPFKNYYIDDWQEVSFPSREKDIKISGWLFNYYKDQPIVIIVH